MMTSRISKGEELSWRTNQWFCLFVAMTERKRCRWYSAWDMRNVTKPNRKCICICIGGLTSCTQTFSEKKQHRGNSLDSGKLNLRFEVVDSTSVSFQTRNAHARIKTGDRQSVNIKIKQYGPHYFKSYANTMRGWTLSVDVHPGCSW